MITQNYYFEGCDDDGCKRMIMIVKMRAVIMLAVVMTIVMVIKTIARQL